MTHDVRLQMDALRARQGPCLSWRQEDTPMIRDGTERTPPSLGRRLGLVLGLASALAAAVVPAGREAREPDAWGALLATGDALASGAPPERAPGRPVTARAAYLLAFHLAQDADDPEHVLAAADRLEAAGEPALAAHVRAAARHLLGDLGTAAPPATAPPDPAPGSDPARAGPTPGPA